MSTLKLAKKNVLRSQVGTQDPQRSPVSNAAGFRKTGLGGDTIPGAVEGAPLVNFARIDDGSVKAKRYERGGPENMQPKAAR